MSGNSYVKPNLLAYRAAQFVSGCVSTLIFHKKMLRNEIKHIKGPFVVIANHQCAYDFVNLIGATNRPMSFVLSNSFYHSLPIQGILDCLGVIPKQQFQTSVREMRKIRSVIEHGQPLVIYPAGLMCEDGLSTPIPPATYKVLKWLDVDVYVARTSGAYFAMPKWTKGFRPGRTYMDIYKLFSKEELAAMSLSEVQEKTDAALLFDAYREQETLRIRYAWNSELAGLENVLYMCPNCESEFTMQIKDRHTLHCTYCGYEQRSDEYAFLHNDKGVGREIRYVSDWSRLIFKRMKERLQRNRSYQLKADTKIHMLDYQKHKFVEVGSGTLTLSAKDVTLQGKVNGQPLALHIPSIQFPTLPFGPGKYLELQHGDEIYRCVFNDGRQVMKFIHMIKASFELQQDTVTV